MMSTAAFQMGKYGIYVWSCYGLTMVGLVFLIFVVRRQWQIELRHAKRRMQIMEQQQTSVSDVHT